jgi:II/X family phage/plasmid replication protein
VIDWLSGRITFDHEPLNGGKVFKVRPDGHIEWTSNCWTDVKGSHDENFRLRSYGSSIIEFSGNPAKWLQGHNLFGCDDLPAVLLGALTDVFSRVGVEHDAVALADACSVATLTRVDLTRSFKLQSREAVRSWIRSAAESAWLRHRGRGLLTKEGTLYFGKHSRRWSIKVYCKADELEAHQLPVKLRSRDRLVRWAEGQLRVEITLRSLQLRDEKLYAPLLWRDNTFARAFDSHLSTLEMSGQMKIPDEKFAQLPPRIRAAYQLWLDGNDLRRVYSRRTFYHYRRQLLRHGVDVALLRPRDPSRDRPDLRRVLTAVPSEVPAWAVGTSLYFEAVKKAA